MKLKEFIEDRYSITLREYADLLMNYSSPKIEDIQPKQKYTSTEIWEANNFNVR